MADLGTFETLNLAAILWHGSNAYGRTIHEKVEELQGNSVAIGSVYTTLDRLEQKGYVKSWFGNPTKERGGRSKRYFELTAAGARALSEAKTTAERWVGALGETGGLA